MARRNLKLSLSSYWHVGSGAGAGAVADAVVLKEAHGLPAVPGRTLKGLLRDAMELASLSGKVPPDRILRWFGSALPGFEPGVTPSGDEQEVLLEKGRYSTQEGLLWFGSARLPAAWQEWARTRSEQDQDIIDALYAYVSSTAIDSDGVAREGSLRVSEVTVPMELVAEVHGPDDDLAWVEDLKVCLPLLRALGKRRNRGYGRVDVSMEAVS